MDKSEPLLKSLALSDRASACELMIDIMRNPVDREETRQALVGLAKDGASATAYHSVSALRTLGRDDREALLSEIFAHRFSVPRLRQLNTDLSNKLENKVLVCLVGQIAICSSSLKKSAGEILMGFENFRIFGSRLISLAERSRQEAAAEHCDGS